MKIKRVFFGNYTQKIKIITQRENYLKTCVFLLSNINYKSYSLNLLIFKENLKKIILIQYFKG